MGKKKVFYLDPDKRKWTMEQLGYSWDFDTSEPRKEIEGTFFMKDGKVLDMMEIHSHCLVCLQPLYYNDEFDSSYCAECNEWREESCSDPNCEYCQGRPEKPSDCI